MKKTLILGLCLITGSTVIAQKADSLGAIIRKTTVDSTKSLLYSQWADALTATDPQKAIESARKGLVLAKAIGFEKGVFENNFSLASAFQGQALFDSAVVYFHRARNVAKHMGDLGKEAEVCSGLGHSFMRKSAMDSSRYYLEQGLALARESRNYRVEAGIYNNYGNVYLEESNYQKALDYFILADKRYEKPLGDDQGRALALSNIGNIEYRLGNYDKALEYAGQSMAIAKRKKLATAVGYAHKLLGRIYRKQKKYDSALAEYKEGQRAYLALGDKRSAAELLQNIGNIYFDKNQVKDALATYHLSLTLAKSIAVKPLVAYGYSCIGQACMALGRNDEALRYLDSSRVVARAIGNKYLLMDNYEAISSVYEAKGDFRKALDIHQQFVHLKDSVTQSENRHLSEETRAKYELEKKEAQIALLEKDKELKNLSIGRHRAIQAGIGLTLVLVIVIALLLVNRYRVHNKVKRLAEIERVRNTIARDLHDDIGSTLSTINIISKLAMRESSDGNALHLNRIAEQSSRMMESMSDMVWSINPVNDPLEKVVVKMKVFAGEILEPKNISYRFSGEELLSNVSLDADKRKNLFLIFKETVNNAAKYSGATHVEITLNQPNGKLIMSVSDNGQGFNVQEVKGGNGLNNMDARAKSMLGLFRLTSVVGQGTRVDLELPLT